MTTKAKQLAGPAAAKQTAKQISWNATKSERMVIGLIARKANKYSKSFGVGKIDKQAAEMDIQATHCNGCKLDLLKMLDGSPADVLHDIYGIARCLDRQTGELKNYFCPRFALPTRHQ